MHSNLHIKMPYYYYLISIPVIYYLLRKLFNGPKTPLTNTDTMKDKIILITGSSAGIGKETAFELLRNGANVIFACRDEKKTLALINSLPEQSKKRATFIELDLSSFESAKNFEKKFSQKFSKIDIIINNAGVFNDKISFTKDNIETVFQSNHLTHMYLTVLLLKYLSKEKGRILNVSSDAHKWVRTIDFENLEKDLNFKNKTLHSSITYNYGFSKLANIFFTVTLAKFFEKNKIDFKVASIHPGMVATEIMRPTNLFTRIIKVLITPLLGVLSKDSVMGAQTTLHCCYIDFYNLINGGYYTNCRLDKISQLAMDDSARKRFMEYSLKLIAMNIADYPEDLNDMIKC